MKTGNESTEVGVFQELHGLVAVAVHAVHDEFFELGIEELGEIVERVGLAL